MLPTDSTGIAPRILIVRVGAMGDVLHALSAVALLRANLPAATLRWAVEPRWSALLQTSPDAPAGSEAMPLLDGIHAVGTRQWSRRPLSFATVRSVLALRRELRGCRYDVAIDLQGSLRSAVIAWMSGARTVIGPAAPREAPARWFYNRRVATAATHVIDQGREIAHAALQVLSAIPAGAAAYMEPLLPHAVDADRWADRIVGDMASPMCSTPVAGMPNFSTADAPLVFLAPTAGWGAKQWPAEHFASLAAALVRRGCTVVVNATPPLPDAVAADVLHTMDAMLPEEGRNRVHVVAATLPQLIALLRRVSLVIAGDTGPLHLAAALGIPTVALFGPTDPARNGPHPADRNPAHSIVLRDPASVTDHRRHAATEAGLARIPVDTVLAAALKLLR